MDAHADRTPRHILPLPFAKNIPLRVARNTPQKRIRNSQKERHRNQNINRVFEDLRHLIPHVPASRRLPKIKTLRLAASYIEHLTAVLEGQRQDDFSQTVKSELNAKNSYKDIVNELMNACRQSSHEFQNKRLETESKSTTTRKELPEECALEMNQSAWQYSHDHHAQCSNMTTAIDDYVWPDLAAIYHTDCWSTMSTDWCVNL